MGIINFKKPYLFANNHLQFELKMAWNPYLLKDNKFRGQSIETYVQGSERVKYFKRPVIPMIKTVPPEVVM